VNFTFHLPRDTELAVGGRHLDYKKTGYTLGTLLPQGAFVAAPLPACGPLTSTYPGTCNIPASAVIRNTTALPLTPGNVTDHSWIYNISLSHKLNQDFLVYVSSGSSWRPPGVAVGIFNAASDPTLTSLINVKPEKSYSVETGFKLTFLDNRARFNAAFYHQHFNRFIYLGLPVVYLSDNGSGNPSATSFQFTSNPDAVVNGVDLDAGLRLTREWTFDLTASYASAHLTGSPIPCNPPGGGTTAAAFPTGTHVFLCPSSASINTTPNFNFSAQTEYDHPLPGSKRTNGFIRGLYTFFGRNPHASEFYVTPSYGLLNVYLGLRDSGGLWEVSAFAKNALNTKRVLSLGYPAITDSTLAATFGSSGYFDVLMTPRQEFGLTATYSFGSR
jgi:iron complex outermembrane receptor protein